MWLYVLLRVKSLNLYSAKSTYFSPILSLYIFFFFLKFSGFNLAAENISFISANFNLAAENISFISANFNLAKKYTFLYLLTLI